MVRVREVAPECLHADANLFQSALWARFKQRRNLDSQAFHVRHHGVEHPLVVVHRELAEDAAVAYAPHGPDIPVPAEEQGPFLEEVAERLRPKLPSACRFMRFDLPWASPYAEEGELEEAPEPRVREMRMNFGCRRWNLRKAPTDLQPPDTVILDLTKPADRLLAEMDPKHRYCVRTAFRRGVRVRAGGAELLPDWHRMHVETAERHGIVAEDVNYFRALLQTAERHEPVVRLYLAEDDEEALAGSVICRVNSRAYYLFSASTERGRAKLASFAVLWRAIRDAKEAGVRSFDLLGIPPDDRPDHPMHGLYRFKTRFGGKVRRLRGCWDFPYDEDAYSALAFASDLARPFHR